MICLSLTADTMAEALEMLADPELRYAELLELRLDLLQDKPELEKLFGASPLPCIATCRPEREGGGYRGSEEERLRLLNQASLAGAAYIDIEAESLPAFKHQGKAQIIASYHNFAETPENLPQIVAELEKLPCAIIKFATMANQLTDNLLIWQALQQANKPAIGLGMGELGECSRILALRQGSFLTFAALAKGKESAPGQLTACDLSQLYQVNKITEKTKLYAVVGNPIAHSISPEIHNAAFRNLGLDAVYLRFKVDDFAAFLQDFAVLELQGLSVTIPHKYAALQASTTLDSVAEKIGAVNTLTRQGTGWKGDNTDWQAAVGAIIKAAQGCNLNFAASKTLLLGAGGAARAIGYGLREIGCKVIVANRTLAKAEALAEELGGETVTLAEAGAGDYAVVANSTSIGMYPEIANSPVTSGFFHQGMVAFDAVYNPRRTLMLKQAQEQGAEIVEGVEMFVGQAMRQFEIWTGRKAPGEVMRDIVIKRLTGKY